jgi:hypothetical protein
MAVCVIRDAKLIQSSGASQAGSVTIFVGNLRHRGFGNFFRVCIDITLPTLSSTPKPNNSGWLLLFAEGPAK